MTTIVESVEISRTPADVFAYVTDPSHLPEWQESVVDVQQDDGPVEVGKRVVVTRKAGPPNWRRRRRLLHSNHPARGQSEALTDRFAGMSKDESSQ